jgi:hypothetical protein
MRLVIVESPYSGNIRKNRAYARKAVRDCLLRGESPIASHLLHTQPTILKDGVPEERAMGMEAGWAWMPVADAVVVYADYGFSMGMFAGMKRAGEVGVPLEIRYLFKRQGVARTRTKAKPTSGDAGKGSGLKPLGPLSGGVIPASK